MGPTQCVQELIHLGRGYTTTMKGSRSKRGKENAVVGNNWKVKERWPRRRVVPLAARKRMGTREHSHAALVGKKPIYRESTNMHSTWWYRPLTGAFLLSSRTWGWVPPSLCHASKGSDTTTRACWKCSPGLYPSSSQRSVTLVLSYGGNITID